MKFVIISAMLLTACAEVRPANDRGPKHDISRYERDHQDCAAQARVFSQHPADLSPYTNMSEEQHIYEMCMLHKGWGRR